MPVRVQRKRTKGWRMPADTISVCRPGPWGNMFIISPKANPGARSGCEYICVPTAEDAKECYREYMKQNPDVIALAIKELNGKHLACFCKIGEPCHADVLLEFANPKDPTPW